MFLYPTNLWSILKERVILEHYGINQGYQQSATLHPCRILLVRIILYMCDVLEHVVNCLIVVDISKVIQGFHWVVVPVSEIADVSISFIAFG